MASSKQLFRTKSPKFEEDLELEHYPPKKKGKKIGKSSVAKKAEPTEYTVSGTTGIHHVSPKALQRLKVMGCSAEYISDLLHTVNVLENYSNRVVDPSIFQDIKIRYHLGMGTMASLASLSNLRLSDIGVDLRGLARFYSRNRADIGDVDELEKFVSWLQSRGEPVKGVPSAWSHYKSLNKPRRTARRISTRRKVRKPSARRSKKKISKGKRSAKSKRKSSSKKSSSKRRRKR
jgi:hypothetical protein